MKIMIIYHIIQIKKHQSSIQMRALFHFIISIMIPVETKYPSTSEFNFELTENLISSPLHSKKCPNPSRISLQYTLSQISIEHELEDQVPNFLDSLPYSSLKDKECGYITASTRHSLGSVKTSFQTIRIRTQSCKQHASLQKMKATVAICPIFFDKHFSNQKSCHRKGNSNEKFRLRKSISARQRKNSENIPSLSNRHVIEQKHMQKGKEKIMNKAFRVKMISLQQNEARGKIYMKKLLQNRASILHLSEASQQYPWDIRGSAFRP